MKKMKLIEEFKAFISKGNVVDMAVGVVVGGAFGKIVTSLVSDLIMPLVGLATGGGLRPREVHNPRARGRGRICHAQLRQLHPDRPRLPDNRARHLPRHKAHGNGEIKAHTRKARGTRAQNGKDLPVLLHRDSHRRGEMPALHERPARR